MELVRCSGIAVFSYLLSHSLSDHNREACETKKNILLGEDSEK